MALYKCRITIIIIIIMNLLLLHLANVSNKE